MSMAPPSVEAKKDEASVAAAEEASVTAESGEMSSGRAVSSAPHSAAAISFDLGQRKANEARSSTRARNRL